MDEQSRYSQILDVAEEIVRSRGYNGFSYADVASIVGLSKASLHHHFPTKADLGLELITRFEENVMLALEEIDNSGVSNITKLRKYADIFEASLLENKMCLCGMLAAEHETLSESMQNAISVFFERNEVWVADVLTEGKKAGEIKFSGSAIDQAQLFIASLQGALQIAKSMNSLKRIKAVASNLVDSYRVKSLH